MVTSSFKFSNKLQLKQSKINGIGQFLKFESEVGEILVTAGGFFAQAKQFDEFKDTRGFSCIWFNKGNNFLYTLGGESYNKTHLNHSCCPNLKFEFPYWKALIKISADEEVTTDYSLLGYPYKNKILIENCNCGSPFCRKVIYAN